jgi:oligopeptide transport system substrate-binding protein
MLKLLIVPLALILLLCGFAAWSGGGVEEPANLVYINRGDANTLDLNRMSWAQDIRLAYALWEGLYTLDPKTLEPVPGSASHVDISEDRRTYTFHLRPEARWSNGDPLTVDGYIFTWRRQLEYPDEYAGLFHCIVGARAYQEAFNADDRVERAKADWSSVGIRKIDDHTLEVRLIAPTAYFLNLTAFPSFFPSHEPSMRPFRQEDKDGRVSYNEGYTHPPHLVTNGPYLLKEWKFKQRVRVVANPYYWNAANVGPRIIDQVACEDPLAMFLMYESGSVDWLLQVDQGIAAELLKQGRQDLHVFPGFGTYFYSINCQPTFSDGTRNPLADMRLRQALAMSIDKRPIVETITRTGEQVQNTYIPPTIFPNYPSPGGLEYDVAKARALLAEAGYPGGAGLPRISIIFNTGAHHEPIAQIIRRQWMEKLGIQVDLQGIELSSFRERLNKKEYMIARASWLGDYNDPSTFTDKYRSTSHGNDAGWVNKAYDALLDAAFVEPDPARRLQLLAQAEGILNREAPIIPIYGYTNAFLFRKKIKNIPLHPQALFLYHPIRIEDDSNDGNAR